MGWPRFSFLRSAMRTARRDRRFQVSLLLIVFFSAVQIGEPIDLVLDSVGNNAFSKAPSGQIIVVDATGSGIEQDAAAKMLLDAQANVVTSETDSDVAFGNGKLEYQQYIYTDNKKDTLISSYSLDWWLGVNYLYPSNTQVAAERALSGNQTISPNVLRVNYLIDPKHIPSFKLSDIIADNSLVANKNIQLIGYGNNRIELNAPGVEKMNTNSLSLLTAESIRTNGNKVVPHYFSIALALFLFVYLARHRKAQILPTSLFIIVSLAFLSQLARLNGFALDVSSGIIATSILAFYTADKRRRQKAFDSNLRNHSYLIESSEASGRVIIAARVKSYLQFTYGLTQKQSKAFVDEIESRLSFIAGANEIFETQPGEFVWAAQFNDQTEIIDHLTSAARLLNQPVKIDDKTINLSIAFGAEFLTDRDLEKRVQSARIAARSAEDNRSPVEISEAAIEQSAQDNLMLIGEIDDAIANGEIYTVYQPKVSLTSGNVTSYETLARWKHPVRGHLSPFLFVGLAEQNGKSFALTEHILNVAFGDSNSLGHAMPFSVNVSPSLLSDDRFVGMLQSLIEKHALPPHLLYLEIIETEMMESSTAIRQRLEHICSLGIHISIDDYGTGYSNLENLRTLKASELKLDKQFVSELETNALSARLISTTLALGNELGMSIVVEGVETEAQAAMLRSIGIETAQGYYFAKPMKHSKLADILATNRPIKKLA